MKFHDTRFPLDISFGSSGGPERRTDIITLASGHEERNTQWESSRRRYNAGYGIRSFDDIHEIVSFFEARRGRLHGFRWRDPMDWKSCALSAQPSSTDQPIGKGDGMQKTFPLSKIYRSFVSRWRRIITKPVLGTVKVAIDRRMLTEEIEFTVDLITGEIIFNDQHIPAKGTRITAGFEFDVPVRFDTDYLEIDLTAFHAGQIPEIPIVEIRS